MCWPRHLGKIVLAFSALCGNPVAAQHENPDYSPADIARGKVIYAERCSRCHGADGNLINGVDLGNGRFRRPMTDDELRQLIMRGIPGTSMPSHALDDADQIAIVAYVKNMRGADEMARGGGDAASGGALFAGKGQCQTCHRVSGKGSHRGPDLTDIGSIRSGARLNQSLVDPSSVMLPINRPVTLVLKNGTVVNGRRLNEDTYTVQIVDEQERLRSFLKADLRKYEISTTSQMPQYKDRLSPSEFSDVIAYLMSLKGK